MAPIRFRVVCQSFGCRLPELSMFSSTRAPIAAHEGFGNGIIHLVGAHGRRRCPGRPIRLRSDGLAGLVREFGIDARAAA